MALNKMISNQEMDVKLKEIFQETGKNMAPANFTQNLMNRIDKEVQTAHIVYKPLISKWGWAFISVFVMAILATVITSSSNITGQGHEITQLIRNTFSFSIQTDGFMRVSSQVTQYLLSSKIFLSLIGILGLGIIHTFLYQKIEQVRNKQVLHF